MIHSLQGIGLGRRRRADLSRIMASSPAALYSTRRLNAAYSGSAIRVRRSSDNAEQDIGFASSALGAELDTSALTSFVGANSAYVVTWYDQSGNGRDATNATTAEQPRIVNSGTIDTMGGKNCVYYNASGANKRLQATYSALGSAFTIFVNATYWSSGVKSFVEQYYSSASVGLGVAVNGQQGCPAITQPGGTPSATTSCDIVPPAASTPSIYSYSSPFASDDTNKTTARCGVNGSNGVTITHVGTYSGSLTSSLQLGSYAPDHSARDYVFYSSELATSTRKAIEEALCMDHGLAVKNPAIPSATAYGLTLSGFYGVYAFRKLVSDYDGPACVVCRESDGALMALEFNGSGEIDTSALTSWAGSNSVRVMCWCDQTGKGNSLYSSQEARIVVSGTLQTMDGDPCVTFLDQGRSAGNGFWTGGAPMAAAWTFVSAVQRNVSDWTGLLGVPLSTNALGVGFSSSGNADLQCNGSSDTAGSQNFATGTNYIIAYRAASAYSGGNYTVTPSKDGVDGSNLTLNYSTRTIIWRDCGIGHSGRGGDAFRSGKMGEVALATSSLSTSDQNAIETSMGSRFSVTIT